MSCGIIHLTFRKCLMSKIKKFVSILCLIVMLFALLSACNKRNKVREYDSTSVIHDDVYNEKGKLKYEEDRRPTTYEEKTYTFAGKTHKYNKNTRNILAMSGAGDLVAFGIKPKAMMYEREYPEYFKGTAILENTQPFDKEEVRKYKPDLIFVYEKMSERDQERLREIAPVIPLLSNSFSEEKRLRQLQEIFDLDEAFVREKINYVNELKAKYKAAIKRLVKDKETLTFFCVTDGITILKTDSWHFNYIAYKELNINMLQTVYDEVNRPGVMPFSPLSPESIREYEGDINICVDLSGTVQKFSNRGNKDRAAAWKFMKSVKDNTMLCIPAKIYSTKEVLFLNNQYGLIYSAIKYKVEKLKK